MLGCCQTHFLIPLILSSRTSPKFFSLPSSRGSVTLLRFASCYFSITFCFVHFESARVDIFSEPLLNSVVPQVQDLSEIIFCGVIMRWSDGLVFHCVSFQWTFCFVHFESVVVILLKGTSSRHCHDETKDRLGVFCATFVFLSNLKCWKKIFIY